MKIVTTVAGLCAVLADSTLQVLDAFMRSEIVKWGTVTWLAGIKKI
jgi:hypothetical protein